MNEMRYDVCYVFKIKACEVRMSYIKQSVYASRSCLESLKTNIQENQLPFWNSTKSNITNKSRERNCVFLETLTRSTTLRENG